MSDRALIRAGTVGVIFAAICCATPLLAVTLPLTGLGAWLTGSGLVVLSLIAAGLGLVAWHPSSPCKGRLFQHEDSE